MLLTGCTNLSTLNRPGKERVKKKLNPTYTAFLKEEPLPFDPISTPPEKANLLSQVLESLVKYDNFTMKALPALAVNWSSDSHYREWLFHLRRNVSFSNGEILVAQTVKKCWERACREGKENQSVKEIFSHLEGYEEFVSGRRAEIKGIQAVDDFTLKVSLKKPDSIFPQKLGVPVAFVYSIAEWSKNPEIFGKRPTGTGPFLVSSWEKGNKIVLKRNPYYWGKKPALQKIVFFFFKSSEEAWRAFQRGKVQEVFADDEICSQLKPQRKLRAKLKSFPVLALSYLMFNLKSRVKISREERDYLFSLVKAKKISSRLEKERLKPADFFVPPFLWDAGPRKRAVFSESFSAGSRAFSGSGPSLSRIVLTFPSSNEYSYLAKLLAQDFQAERANLKIQLLDWPLFFEALNGKNLILFPFFWVADYPSSEAFLRPLFHSKGEANFSFFNSSRFDILINQSSQLEGEKRKVILEQATKLVEEEKVARPLFYTLSSWLVSDKVKNFRANGYGWVDYAAITVLE